MIKFEGKYKVSANEFSKLFMSKSIDLLIENMRNVYAHTPEIYNDFTDKEKSDIIEQLGKRAEGLQGYLGIDKLKSKIEYDK